MSTHPLNHTFRFLLELSTLCSFGYWGWTQHEGFFRFIWMIALPVTTAILWGTFAVPNDPSRSGKTLIPTAGFLRLLLELAFFALGVWCLFSAGQPTWGWILGVLVIFHYAISYDRIIWLLKQ